MATGRYIYGKHVPAPKTNIMDGIMSRLYTVNKKEFEDRIAAMAVSNAAMMLLDEESKKHFTYLGVLYNTPDCVVPRLKTRLHPDLHEKWQKGIEWRQAALQEANKVKNFISGLFNQYPLPKILTVLPYSLHSLFDGTAEHFKPLERTEEEFQSFLDYHKDAIRVINIRLTEELLFS